MDIKHLSLSVDQVAIWDRLHSLGNSVWHLYGLGRPVIIGLLLCVLTQWHKCRTIVACQVVNILAVFLLYHYICEVCFAALNVYNRFHKSLVLFYSLVIPGKYKLIVRTILTQRTPFCLS